MKRMISFAAAVLVAGLVAFGVAHAGSPEFLTAAQGLFDPAALTAAIAMMPAAVHGHAPAALNNRSRGLVAGVRADGNPIEILNEIKRTFEAFKEANDKEIADLKKGQADVVQSEKVERINAQLTELNAAMDAANETIAGLRAGGGDHAVNPEVAAHATAFDGFFRRGVESNLRELEVKAALQTGSDPDGGYTVPEQMESTITELLRTVSAIRSLATVMTVSGGTYKKLVNKQGATAGWVGETEARPETNTAQLAALEYPSMELYAMPAATQTMLEDSSLDIAAWLGNEVNLTFADMEGAAFVNGTGVSQPKGFLQAQKVANTGYVWGKLGFVTSGAAATFASSNPGDKLIDLVHALRSGYRSNGNWVMNDLTLAEVRKFKDGEGNYLWRPGLEQGKPSLLLGYPVVTDDNMPDIAANAFPIAFGDFRRGYLIVDRRGIRVLRDPFTAKPYVMFYTTRRVGGGIQNFEAIKLFKISA